VSKWLADRNVSTEYRRHLLYAVFSFVRYLIEQEVFESNPIDAIARPKKGKPRTRWETEETDIRIVEAAPRDYRGIFAVIKSTGAEVSPVLDPKFRPRSITLWDEDDLRYCGFAHIAGTKTATRDRHDVLIEKWARPYIEELLKGKHPNAPLFTGITRYAAHYHHQATCDALGIEDYTLRDSRHSWAVRGRKARPQVTFEEIAEQLGNTVAVVSDRYAVYKMTPEERLAATKTATKKLRVTRGGKR
jgi:integrase